MNEVNAVLKPKPYAEPNNFRSAEILSCVDGDTVKIRIHAGFPGNPSSWGGYDDDRVRLAGINAPEMKTHDGPPAKAHLEKLVREYCHERCVVEILGRDNYGRFGVVIYGFGSEGAPVNLNQRMIDDNYAEEYHGGKIHV